jgi:hypothetical protein
MSRLSGEDAMGDPMSPYEEDIHNYGQAVIVPQNTVRLATSSGTHLKDDVGEGGGEIDESISKLIEAMQRLSRAVTYGDESDVKDAADNVDNAVDDLQQDVERGASKEEAMKAENALGYAEEKTGDLLADIRSFNHGSLRSTRNMGAGTPATAKFIGDKENRDMYRERIQRQQQKINECRATITQAKREISSYKRMITKDKRMERKARIVRGTRTAINKASTFVKEQTETSSKIPSVGGTLKAEGTLPVGDRLSDGSKGSAFFHSIIGCEDKEDFENEFKIANRFFKKQYGLDFSDENPEVVKDGLKRTIGDVVTMEPFGLNHKITHKVETANMHIGELSPAGSDVYDGGFKVEVKQPIELGGNFEREAEDAVVPAGTKMLHGYMDLMDASGDNSAVRIAYRTKQPIVASGGNTYSMVGNLVSHEAPKFAIKRTLYVNKKGGENHVVMATEFGH